MDKNSVPVVTVVHRPPIDPAVQNLLDPLHDTPDEMIQKELEKLRLDKAAFKASEVWRRRKRLACMNRTKDLYQNFLNYPLIAKIEEIACSIRGEKLSKSEEVATLPFFVTPPERQDLDRKMDASFKRELTKALKKKDPVGTHNRYDLDWSRRVTIRNLSRVWDILKGYGYTLYRQTSPDGLEDVCVFINNYGRGIAFKGMLNFDFVFDMYLFGYNGNFTLTNTFIQRPGGMNASLQGVPPSFDSNAGEIILNGMEVRNYLQNWRVALDVVKKEAEFRSFASVQEEEKHRVNANVVLASVLAFCSESPNPKETFTQELASLGVDNPKSFMDTLKNILGETRVKRLVSYYLGNSDIGE